MKLLVVLVFIILGLVACGKTGSKEASQNPAQSSPTPDTPQSNDSSNDEQAGTNSQDLPFTASKDSVDAPSVGIPIKQTQPSSDILPKTTDIPDSSVGIKNKPVETSPRKTTKIIGLGRNVKNTKNKLVYDDKSALLQARTCQKTGAFTDGSRCFILFADKSQEWVDDSNRTLIDAFIKEIRRNAQGS
jgi:hypothetical protein